MRPTTLFPVRYSFARSDRPLAVAFCQLVQAYPEWLWTFSFERRDNKKVNIATLKEIRDELESVIVGHAAGRIFQLSRFEIALDLQLAGARYLFISVEPADPRIYLIRRKLRDLEKASANPSPFVLQARKILGNAVVGSITQIENERILVLDFASDDGLGEDRKVSLVVQLTGRSANLFLINHAGLISGSLRKGNGDGQVAGTVYDPPLRPAGSVPRFDHMIVSADGHASLSEALDAESQKKKFEREFDAAARSAREGIGREISKRERLFKGLDSDLEDHGDPERWKRFGDLLLANISTALKKDGLFEVTDLFDEAQPTIGIEVEENESVSEAAERYFRQYTKARKARVETQKRKLDVEAELIVLRAERERIEALIAERDLEQINEVLVERKSPIRGKHNRKAAHGADVARIFVSSDGYEILVGKKAKDNDFLTFRVAKSLDTWMHAADYPGSHVVIRNPNRRSIPQKTLLEAAELAAFYSKGKTQPKAAVHYTQKKFVNKQKGSAAGSVSLASFKTLLVEPKVSIRSIR